MRRGYILLAGMLMAAHAGAADAPAFTAKQLTDLPTNGWVTNGGTFTTNAPPLAQTTASNVGSMRPNGGHI